MRRLYSRVSVVVRGRVITSQADERDAHIMRGASVSSELFTSRRMRLRYFPSALEILNRALIGIAFVNAYFFDQIVPARVSVLE